MDKIEWDSSFNVGVGVIDEQHKQIIKVINILISGSDTTVRSEMISDTLTQLTRYASEHFQTEERLLEENGYPEIQQHKEQHKMYRFKVTGLCMDTIEKQDAVPSNLLQFIHDWWKDHILISDMEYKSFLEKCGVS